MATYTGTSGNDNITGSAFADTINLLGGDDIANGGDGNDTIYGDAGNDDISGGNGDDNLLGGTGIDVLRGGNGADYFEGGDNGDILYGGTSDGAADIMYGQNGNDDLYSDGAATSGFTGFRFSGSVVDQLYGGAGVDYFYINSRSRINDFDYAAGEKIGLPTGIGTLNIDNSGTNSIVSVGGNVLLEAVGVDLISSDFIYF